MGHKELFLEKLEEYEKDPEYILYSLIFEINEEICKALEKNNLNYKQFAEKINVKPAYISKLLNGQPNLSLKSLVKIAIALNLKLRVPFYEEQLKFDLNCLFINSTRESPGYTNRSLGKQNKEAPNANNNALAA